MGGINTGYLQTNRGIIKIGQIIMGIILCGMMCGSPSGHYGVHCFGEGRTGYTSALVFVTLIINIVLFVLNLLNLAVIRLERVYGIVGLILYLIAFAVLVWYLIVAGSYSHTTLIIGCVLLFLMFITYLYDVKIIQGEMPNH